MFQPLELCLGLRYTRAKRRNHFISFISLFSILGVALGVATLIVVLSVMNGFEKTLRERILGMASHATISALVGQMTDWRRVAAAAVRHPEVLAAAPYVEAEVMLNRGSQVGGAVVRGVLPEEEKGVSEIADKMVAGRLEALVPGGYGIVLGRELALLLGVSLGDRVTVITPQAASTPVGILPRMRAFEVVGIFEVGMYEYDRAMAFVHLADAQRLLRLGEGVTGVRLKLVDMDRARQVAGELAESLGGGYWVSDWTRRHVNFFRAVQMEKRVMFVILTLILAVAAFNIVSTLVMVVTDKQADIAILRTLGMTPARILRVFVIQGSLIGVLGTVLGVAGGVAIAANVEAIVAFLERLFHVKFLAPDVYYISELPSDLRRGDVLVVASVAFALSILATLYPAWRASRVEPAEALRYE